MFNNEKKTLKFFIPTKWIPAPLFDIEATYEVFV
jgi:hypothetical protein